MSGKTKEPDVNGAVDELIAHSWRTNDEPNVIKVREVDWLALRDAHERQCGLQRCPTCDQIMPVEVGR